jgi:hypothetical protein
MIIVVLVHQYALVVQLFDSLILLFKEKINKKMIKKKSVRKSKR